MQDSVLRDKMSGLLTVCFVRPPEKLVSKTAPQLITFFTRRKKGLKGGMIQIHSATLQIARQENCLPARPFLPFSPSRRLSVSAVRPPRPDASKVNAEDRPITGSPFHSMKYRYPSPASRRWMGRTRSNIRQKQRRPSLPCSYFPFLSTRRRRGRHGQGRQVGHYPRAKTLPSSGTARQLSYPSPALHSKAWL